MYSYGEFRFLLYIQRKILIKKCFIDQKRAKSCKHYSHCTSDPRNPYHNLLAPFTRNFTIFNYTDLSLPAQDHVECGEELHRLTKHGLCCCGSRGHAPDALGFAWTDSAREGVWATCNHTQGHAGATFLRRLALGQRTASEGEEEYPEG